MTLEEYLKENHARDLVDHRLRAWRLKNGKIQFYIHPHDTSGETLDFTVDGNTLVPTGDKEKEDAR